MKTLLLNCDMGESFGAWKMGLDDEIMPHIDLASIACGFHAGDHGVMRHTVSLALRHSVRIGAHPAYPDLAGFGRRSMHCSEQEIEDLLHYQIGALDGICRAQGTRVSYVKPHGALYNDMMREPRLLHAVMRAIAAYDPDLPLVVLARSDNSEVTAIAASHGLQLMFEAFADRAYDADGQLLSRAIAGAVHQHHDTVVAQALDIAAGRPLTAADGSPLLLQADTLCVHGDNPAALAAIRQIRAGLQAATR
ncbi:MAG: 5-oxoprolinase subunit PxpA [Pseudomonadaceae bacterium]